MENNIEGRSPRILAVDDDHDFLEMLVKILTENGFEVFSANSAEDFEEKAFSCNPDLIILDIQLDKGEEGPVIYDRLVAKGFKKTPIIFLSGLAVDCAASPASTGRSYALHAKPIEMNVLVNEINRMLRKNNSDSSTKS